MARKKQRVGAKRPGEISREGRALCYYLEGGGESTPMGKVGIGRGTTDKTGYMDLKAEIGDSLRRVTEEERRLTGRSVRVNTLVKRWANYLAMVRARNALKTYTRLSKKAQNSLPSPWAYEKLKDAEEGILTEQKTLEETSERNEKIRRSTLYIKLMDVFRQELNKRNVRI